MKFRVVTLFKIVEHGSKEVTTHDGDDVGEAYHPQHHVKWVIAHYG